MCITPTANDLSPANDDVTNDLSPEHLKSFVLGAKEPIIQALKHNYRAVYNTV